MQLFLQVLGAIFLLLILTVVVAVLAVRAKVRKFVKTLEAISKSTLVNPSRIHLTPLVEPHWNDPAGMETRIDGIEGLGFEKAGDFEVDELDGMLMQAWVNPDESATCVFFETRDGDSWIDIFTVYQDVSRFTITNGSKGEGSVHPPDNIVAHAPGLGVRALYAQYLAKRPDKSAEPVSAATFAHEFECDYNDEMDWRDSHGGPTEDEIRHVAALAGAPYDDSVIKAAHDLTEREALDDLAEALREHFLEESKISALEWERARDLVVFIHDKMTQELFDEAVAPWLEEGKPPDIGEEPGERPREVFAQLNELLPPHEQFKRLGKVSKPIEADVYTVPEA